MLKPSTLSRKFSLLLGLTFLVGLLIAYGTLSQALNAQVEAEVAERAAILLQTMQAARDYTSDHISPLVRGYEPQSEVETPPYQASDPFQPQMIPNFAADEIFERFRRQAPDMDPFQLDFSAFEYKEAATNPSKVEDLADGFEASLIEQFKQTPDLTFQKGYRSDHGSEKFYIARPIVVRSQSCLQCHGNPQDAPLAMRKLYGEEWGYGWQMNEVVATQTIYVPTDVLIRRGNTYLTLVMAIFIAIFLVAILVINFGLQRTVTRPLGHLTTISEAISLQNTENPQALAPNRSRLQRLSRRRDELGKLAVAFQFMVQILMDRARDLQDAVNARTQELQQEMRDRQKAQEALQIYFHAISHDLRNLVTGTSLMLQGLLQTAVVAPTTCAKQTAPSSNQEESMASVPSTTLTMLNKTCDRQLKLVNSLMKAHDAEIWGSMLQLEPLNLKNLVDELHLTWQSRLEQQQAQLHNDISSQLPMVAADPNQLCRVFENLMENALKYNSDSIEITVRAQVTAAESSSDAAIIRCEVIDNGVGVDADQGEQLFELYHRQVEQASVQGFGLGLYICRQIITAHGGQIGVDSAQNSGARFWFTLPLQPLRS